MAVHRRVVEFAPPARLVVFDEADWPADSWEGSFQQWCEARRDWVRRFPSSPLGNILDLMKGERRARFGDRLSV